jgi:N-glycosidase YbiA
MNEILFYRVRDEYGAFSNFALYPIWLDGRMWPTSEHYFQAQKFKLRERQEAIRLTNSPLEAARMGRDRSWTLRTDWDEVKDEVMREAVWAKFAQNSGPRELLLSTGRAKIVERTENDRYWGDGGDGGGRNMLGLILMEVRDRILKVDGFTCTEEWEEARGTGPAGPPAEYLSEWLDLRSLLWEKHFQSLPEKEQKLINEGTHPSCSSKLVPEVGKYAEFLRRSLSSVPYVTRVSVDAYHGDFLVLTVWLNRKSPWREYRAHIPQLFMGFEVFVAGPTEG